MIQYLVRTGISYRRIGNALESAFRKLGLEKAWYSHRGSIRMSGKKLAGFLISEAEDIYVINVICFIRAFQPSDFFTAIWVPPEVKDKILEPLTSIEEELGTKPSDDDLKNVITASIEKSFNVKLKQGDMTREEKFGYEKQRSLAFRAVKKDTESKGSVFKKIKGIFFK